jgi:hypothetical protein
MEGTMRRVISRAAVGAALGLAAAVLVAPGLAAANAQVTVNPSTVAPGGTVTVTVRCGSGATAASVSATSFGGPSEVALSPFPAGGPGAFTGRVTVPASTAPGTFAISATCNNGEGGTGTLVVSPTGHVTAGGGSTSDGANVALIAAGAGMIALAGVGAWILVGRRGTGAAPG